MNVREQIVIFKLKCAHINQDIKQKVVQVEEIIINISPVQKYPSNGEFYAKVSVSAPKTTEAQLTSRKLSWWVLSFIFLSDSNSYQPVILGK